MKIPIKDIKVKSRIREDLGDIDALADSMQHYGQISPIVISKKNVLIAGGRRLEAAKILGWTEIEAVVSNVSGELKELELEIEENRSRKGFSDAESEKAAKKIYKLRNPSFIRRVWNAIVGFFKKLFRIED